MEINRDWRGDNLVEEIDDVELNSEGELNPDKRYVDGHEYIRRLSSGLTHRITAVMIDCEYVDDDCRLDLCGGKTFDESLYAGCGWSTDSKMLMEHAKDCKKCLEMIR